MIKVLSTLLFLLISLDARENPFFPDKGEQDILQTSNKDMSLPSLNRATIALPPQSRTLKKVTVEYQNLDGSLETKSIELNNAIDWHLPLFISQSYGSTSKAKVLKKKKSLRKKVYKKIAQNKNVKFFTSEKILKIISNDKIIRNFLLVNPHRIVIDFEKDISMKTYTKSISNSVFTKIRVGNHAGYYRVVVELDGHYRYKLSKVNGAYIFKLR